MGFVFGGGGGEGTESAKRISENQIAEQTKDRYAAEAETVRLQGIEDKAQAKIDKETDDEETRRQQRLRGAGYVGYGDSRPLGTGYTLGGG